MSNIQEKNVGEIVLADYRTASVFKEYGIDFCCNGNIPVEKVCHQMNIDPGKLENDLIIIMGSSDQKVDAISDYKSWPLDLLADYIEKKHHRYVTDQLPVIAGYLEKICNVHGHNHPELFEILNLFGCCATEFPAHINNEESMLFPYIREMVQIKGRGKHVSAPFGTVQNPIRMMMHEHDIEGRRFRKIRDLSNSYTPPPDACNTYRLTYSLLDVFENDLHLHIHLENNILFPKAIELEDHLHATDHE